MPMIASNPRHASQLCARVFFKLPSDSTVAWPYLNNSSLLFSDRSSSICATAGMSLVSMSLVTVPASSRHPVTAEAKIMHSISGRFEICLGGKGHDPC